MKKNSLLGLALLALTACDSNLEKVHYNASEAKPATLHPIESVIVLDAQRGDEVAVTFRWTPTVVNYLASVTTDLQMGLNGERFAEAVTLASTKTDSVYAITTADLNTALLKLQEAYGLTDGPMNVDFRLVSGISVAAPALYSNVVESRITPY